MEMLGHSPGTGSFRGSKGLTSCTWGGQLGTMEVFVPEEEPPVLPRTLEPGHDHSFEVVFRQMQAGGHSVENQHLGDKDGTPKKALADDSLQLQVILLVHVCLQLNVTKNSRRRCRSLFGWFRAAPSPGASFAAETAPWSRSQPGEGEGELSMYPICGVGVERTPTVSGWCRVRRLQRFEQTDFQGRTLSHEQQTPPVYQVHSGRHLGSRIQNASKILKVTPKIASKNDPAGVDSGALSRSLGTSRSRRPVTPWWLRRC